MRRRVCAAALRTALAVPRHGGSGTSSAGAARRVRNVDASTVPQVRACARHAARACSLNAVRHTLTRRMLHNERLQVLSQGRLLPPRSALLPLAAAQSRLHVTSPGGCLGPPDAASLLSTRAYRSAASGDGPPARSGGKQAPSGMAAAVAAADGAPGSDLRILKELGVYIWPQDRPDLRTRVGLAVGLLVASKVRAQWSDGAHVHAPHAHHAAAARWPTCTCRTFSSWQWTAWARTRRRCRSGESQL